MLNAIKNDIKLDIYLDSHSYAIGILYLDDGGSLKHEKGERTLVHYSYKSEVLSTMKLLPDENQFEVAATKKIISLQIHGLEHIPVAVRDLTTGLLLEMSQLSFANGTLKVTGLTFAIDNGLLYN